MKSFRVHSEEFCEAFNNNLRINSYSAADPSGLTGELSGIVCP